MKRILTLIILILLVGNLSAQKSGVLEKGHFLISLGTGYQTRGVPVELSVTYGTFDNVFNLPNLKFGVDILVSYNLLTGSSTNGLLIGGGPTFHYTLLNNFDVMAGFNAGWGFDKFLDNFMGYPTPPNYDVNDLFKYFVIVGGRYSFHKNVGVFAKLNVGNFSSAIGGVYFKW